MTEVHIYKSGCVQWGSLGGRRGPPARPVQARWRHPKGGRWLAHMRAAFGRYSAQAPPPLRAMGFGCGVALLSLRLQTCVRMDALFTCKSASTLCAATPLLVCLIDTYQKGRRNARYSALKYTICLAGKPSTGKPESAQSLEPQIELLVGTFSHELRLQYTSIFRISHCGNPRIQP